MSYVGGSVAPGNEMGPASAVNTPGPVGKPSMKGPPMATVAAPRPHVQPEPAPAVQRKPRTVKPASGVARLTLTINGVDYSVRPLAVPPDSGVSRLLQLRKLADGTVYHASRHGHGDECTCPSFVFDHDGRDDRGCKHLVSLRAVGLLPPLAAGARTTPEPPDAEGGSR